MPEMPWWIKPADPAQHMAQGLQLGIQIGTSQAAQAFRQQQLEFEQQQQAAHEARLSQQDAMRQAQWEAEFGLASSEAARKNQSMMEYRSRIAGGEDPLKVMMELGPSIGAPGSAEAAAFRSLNPSAGHGASPVLPPDIKTFDLPGGGQQTVIWDQHTGSFQKVGGKTSPEFVPEDPETGEPAHYNLPNGGVHVIPRQKEVPGVSPSERTAALKFLDEQRKEIVNDFPKLSRKARSHPELLTLEEKAAIERLKSIRAQEMQWLPKLSDQAAPETKSNPVKWVRGPEGFVPATPSGTSSKTSHEDTSDE